MRNEIHLKSIQRKKVCFQPTPLVVPAREEDDYGILISFLSKSLINDREGVIGLWAGFLSQVRMVATCILIGHLMTLAPSYLLMKNGFSMEEKQ
jgi:hypothetical protein